MIPTIACSNAALQPFVNLIRRFCKDQLSFPLVAALLLSLQATAQQQPADSLHYANEKYFNNIRRAKPQVESVNLNIRIYSFKIDFEGKNLEFYQ